MTTRIELIRILHEHGRFNTDRHEGVITYGSRLNQSYELGILSPITPENLKNGTFAAEEERRNLPVASVTMDYSTFITGSDRVKAAGAIILKRVLSGLGIPITEDKMVKKQLYNKLKAQALELEQLAEGFNSI